MFMYCVIDTERIKGNLIYLLSYQLYDDTYNLIDNKTFQDVSIDLSNRKSSKVKTKQLNQCSIKVNGYVELYESIRSVIENNLVVIFSKTDVHIFKSNCKEYGIQYNKLKCIDMQSLLKDRINHFNGKSNFKDFCKKSKIKHEPHIPESDCFATFCLFQNLVDEIGLNSILLKIEEC